MFCTASSVDATSSFVYKPEKPERALVLSLKNVISTALFLSLVHKSWIYRAYGRLYEAAIQLVTVVHSALNLKYI